LQYETEQTRHPTIPAIKSDVGKPADQLVLAVCRSRNGHLRHAQTLIHLISFKPIQIDKADNNLFYLFLWHCRVLAERLALKSGGGDKCCQ